MEKIGGAVAKLYKFEYFFEKNRLREDIHCPLSSLSVGRLAYTNLMMTPKERYS